MKMSSIWFFLPRACPANIVFPVNVSINPGGHTALYTNAHTDEKRTPWLVSCGTDNDDFPSFIYLFICLWVFSVLNAVDAITRLQNEKVIANEFRLRRHRRLRKGRERQ